MRWYASVLVNYLTPKSSTHRSNVVLQVLCCHSPVVFGVGLYPWGASALTSWLKASTPASLSSYIHLLITVYTSPLAETL